MEMLDFALKIEQDGMEFFSDAADNAHNPAAKKMLLSLADDEKRHLQVIQDLKNGKTDLIKDQSLAGVKNVFESLSQSDTTLFQDDDNLKAVLEKARNLETESVKLYTKLAHDATDPALKEIWLVLCKEEQKHEKLLNLTLEFVGQPAIVLENAEFLFDSDQY
ncbi:MAG: ferritin family protein [Sedimentisphaerales bacterium]|nr:ferritin family protein [Sedimentisphaerales bacterium]